MDKDVQVTDEIQVEQAFDTGFTPDAAPAKPAAAPVEVKKDVPAKPTTPPAKKPTEPVAAQPEFVQLTKADYNLLKTTADKVAAFDGKFDKLAGNLGGINRIVTDLQKATPKGESIVVTDEDFSDMRAEYPELTEQMLKGLRKILAGKVGTGTEVKVASVDPEAVSKIVRGENNQREIDALSEDHHNWRTIVGTVDKDGNVLDPNNEFRIWLKKQPEDYQTRVNSTQRASVIVSAIDKFLVDKAKPVMPPKPKTPPPGAGRRAIIKDAVQPKGDGSTPAPANSAEAAFDEGFKRG